MPPKPRALTQQEKEEEEERQRLEEERLKAEAEEEARYKHVVQLDLNQTTRDPMPSISPRDQLSYVPDKKVLKEISKFKERTPNMEKFMLKLRSDILRAKPDNIVKWVDRHFFSEANIAKMRREFEIVDPDAPIETKKKKT